MIKGNIQDVDGFVKHFVSIPEIRINTKIDVRYNVS